MAGRKPPVSDLLARWLAHRPGVAVVVSWAATTVRRSHRGVSEITGRVGDGLELPLLETGAAPCAELRNMAKLGRARCLRNGSCISEGLHGDVPPV